MSIYPQWTNSINIYPDWIGVQLLVLVENGVISKVTVRNFHNSANCRSFTDIVINSELITDDVSDIVFHSVVTDLSFTDETEKRDFINIASKVSKTSSVAFVSAEDKAIIRNVINKAVRGK